MTGKRELIVGSDKRFVRREQFKESDDDGRSLAADVKRKAKSGAGSVVVQRDAKSGVFQSIRLPNGETANTMSKSVYDEGRKRARKAFK